MEEQQHNMSFWDQTATWIGANANNGTWYIGGVLAALGLGGAMKVLAITGPLAYVLLALVGYMGWQTRKSTMTLTQVSFGKWGSFGPSLVNVVQFMGWAAVNTFIAAGSIGYLLHDLLGWPVFGQRGGLKGIIFGILMMSVLHLISISLGQRSVRVIERVGIVLVIVLVLWETWAVFQTVSLHQLNQWKVPVKFQLPTGNAIDTLAAFNLAWVTAGADFTKFAKTKQAGTVAPFVGGTIGLFWFAMVGVIATIGAAVTLNAFDPNASDPSTVASRLGLGVLAMVVIVLTSTTANAVNLMAAGSALTNVFKRLKLTPALWLVTVVATLMTLIPLWSSSFLSVFTLFLDYVGMILGPEIAIILVDYYILHDRHYSLADFTNAPKINWLAYAAWFVGIVSYFVLRQLPFVTSSLGATGLSMLLTAGLHLTASRAFATRHRHVRVTDK
ncbi:cytosine permease [Furfurilactobacillus siliginis]|uniref:Cytosine permease n=1 Tax=Furfurilactobacillus siliginis TaxID=348151 RepID=A0A0R2LBV3_9LACO|nr:cytosine permease [Furfurilactobacillus siliginis]KRN96167.1 purine-cytosine transport protein [Furfurilactobacillus siliginis]GEK27908.1 cytosine permease [Furfurilactobacillus siliginis]